MPVNRLNNDQLEREQLVPKEGKEVRRPTSRSDWNTETMVSPGNDSASELDHPTRRPVVPAPGTPPALENARDERINLGYANKAEDQLPYAAGFSSQQC